MSAFRTEADDPSARRWPSKEEHESARKKGGHPDPSARKSAIPESNATTSPGSSGHHEDDNVIGPVERARKRSDARAKGAYAAADQEIAARDEAPVDTRAQKRQDDPHPGVHRLQGDR